MKLIIIISMVSLLLLAGCSSQEDIDALAKCLTAEGVKMYGAYWCPNCLNQKKMFGNGWRYMESIECSLPNKEGQTQECIDAGISAYPTWVFPDGRRIEGVQTFEQLASFTNCEL